jgi:hypothetical protein
MFVENIVLGASRVSVGVNDLNVVSNHLVKMCDALNRCRGSNGESDKVISRCRLELQECRKRVLASQVSGEAVAVPALISDPTSFSAIEIEHLSVRAPELMHEATVDPSQVVIRAATPVSVLGLEPEAAHEPIDPLEKWVSESPEDELGERLFVLRLLESKRDGDRCGVICFDFDLDLSGLTTLTSLPENMEIGGSLSLDGCTNLRSLPDGLRVGRDLSAYDCGGLESLPENLRVGRDLRVEACKSLVTLPEDLHIGRDLCLDSCISLVALPEGLRVGRGISAYDCRNLESLPENLQVEGDLDLTRCLNLTHLSENLVVRGSLVLEVCPRLTYLSENLEVGGNLLLNYCTRLEVLPENLQVGADVRLRHCLGLTQLPEAMFGLSGTSVVDAQEAGFSEATVHAIVQRQRTPGYNGPIFLLSVNDEGYRATADLSYADLPGLVSLFSGSQSSHEIWQNIPSNDRSAYNHLATFLTRIHNDFPRDQHRSLSAGVVQVVQSVLRDLESTENESYKKELLDTVESGVGTCVDKVKVSFLRLQLIHKREHSDSEADKEVAQANLKVLDKIMDAISDINLNKIVIDREAGDFFDITNAEGYEYTPELSLRDNFQIALSSNADRYRGMRIGDEVEDILKLAYRMIDDETLVKPDMRFASCCTLNDLELGSLERFIQMS